MTATTAIDEYDWYLRAIETPPGQPMPLLPERAAQCGYYRMQRRDGDWVPVAIWLNESGVKLGKVGTGGETVVTEEWGERYFAYCSKHPIASDTYFAVMEGAPWPDAPKKLQRDYANMPTDDYESIKIELESERDEVARWLEAIGTIVNETDATRAANWADRITGVVKKGDDLRKAEKRPHDEAAKSVQTKWMPFLNMGDSLVARLRGAIRPYLIKREAEAKAAIREVNPGLENRVKVQSGVGNLGRKTSLVTRHEAEIENWTQCLNFFADNADVKALVQKLANKAVNAGAIPPGCKRIEVKDVRG